MHQRLFRLAVLFILVSAAGRAAAREWKDASGKFRIEADVIAVKDGKAYLEKASGNVILVPLEKLCKEDLTFLAGLPDYREYFAEHPIPGLETGSSSGIASGVELVKIKVLDEAKVGQVRRFHDMGWPVTAMAFSSNAGFLAVGKTDRELMVFDINKEERVSRHSDLDELGKVTALAFTPDGRKLLSGGTRGRIQVWDVDADGELTEGNRFVGHGQEIGAIAVSADGRHVLSSGGKGVRYWNLDTAAEEFGVDGFAGAVAAVHLLPTGDFGLASDGAVLVLIDLKKGQAVKTMRLALQPSVLGVAISPDGSHVAVGNGYAIRVWAVLDGRELRPLQDRESQKTAVFSPDGKYLISGGSGKVNVWEVASSRKIQEFDTLVGVDVECLAYSPDRRHVAAIPHSAAQTIEIFRLPAELAE